VKKQKVETPTEAPGVVLARQRQITDLAKLDEEENKRIKQMRSASRGVRAFRALRTGRSGGSSGSSVGSTSGSSGGFGSTAMQNSLSQLFAAMQGG
jgi:hypothetical protein